MVPVRKPGRPLSVCPHKAGQSCGCAGITAAIPRNQKCGCGSNGSQSASPMVKQETVNSKSPGSPTGRSFHIHKPGSVKPSSRIDAAGLERTDISQLNILPPPSWPGGIVPMPTPGFPIPEAKPSYAFPIPNGVPHGFLQQTNVGYDVNYVIGPQGPIQIPLPNGTIAVGYDVNHLSIVHGQNTIGGSPSIASSSVTSSCCVPTANSSPRHTPTSSSSSVRVSSPARATNGNGNSKSCCSNKQSKTPANGSAVDPFPASVPTTPIGNGPETNGSHIASLGAPNGTFIAPYGQPMGIPQMAPNYYHVPGSVVYTYPATYGTFNAPLQPAQWRQAISAPQGHHVHSDGIPMTSIPPQAYSTNGANAIAATSHICTCGDECNCLGCPAHPYNDATQEYVRSAMNSMLETRAVESQTNGIPEMSAVDGVNGTNGSGPGQAPQSPSQAQTPSDASGISEEQSQLSANDFFFVTYPIGDCGGETTSCPCGDDCDCVGCLIHSAGNEVFEG